MSFINICRVSTRHGPTLSKLAHGSSAIARSQLISPTSPLLPRLANAKAIFTNIRTQWYSSSTPELQAVDEATSLVNPADIPVPNELASIYREPSDLKRILSIPIRRAEYELHQIFSPQTAAREDGSARSPTQPTVAQVWNILAKIASEGGNAVVARSSSYNISGITHHLRKLAPYALHVAGLLHSSLHDTSTEHAAEHLELARWCFLSSILFGTPPIPSTSPTDPTLTSSPPRLPGASATVSESGIRDIPKSQWPSKSARNDSHVFSQSKSDQIEAIKQCQRPYLGMARTATEDIEATFTALDTGMQALYAATKTTGRGHSLQSVTILERAAGPVIELATVWLEANMANFNVASDSIVDSVPEGLARLPRILQRLNMRDIAQKLHHQVVSNAQHKLDNHSHPNLSDAINLFLGGCLLRNSDNLTVRLNKVIKIKTPGELFTLWEMSSPVLRRQSDNELGTRLLSVFLSTVVANISKEDPEANELRRILEEIYGLLPRPTPLPVYHSLLSLYAGISTSPAAGVKEPTVSSEASLANLIATWSRMREEKVTPDLKAYMLLITGLGKKGDYQALQQIWEELTHDAECKALWQKEEKSSATYPPMRVLNHFISTLFNLPTATGSATLALSLFHYLCDPKSPYEPDLFTMNTVLRHYARKKDLQAMMDLIDRLPNFRLAPDLVTYTTLITGLLDAGKPQAAKGILDVMQKAKIVPNSYVYSLLIADLARKGNGEAMASAETILQQMKQAGVKPTTTTWTSLASGYFRADMVKEGLDALKRAQSKGLKLDRVAYNMVLRSVLFTESLPVADLDRVLRGQTRQAERSLGNATNTEAALLLLRNMIDSHVEPDSDTWFIVLDGLARQEKWSEGDVVTRLMRSRRFVVKEGSAVARVAQQIRNREQRRRR